MDSHATAAVQIPTLWVLVDVEVDSVTKKKGPRPSDQLLTCYKLSKKQVQTTHGVDPGVFCVSCSNWATDLELRPSLCKKNDQFNNGVSRKYHCQ